MVLSVREFSSWLVLFGLLGAACEQGRVTGGPAFLSTDFTAEQTQSVVTALDEWRRATAHAVDFTPVLRNERDGEHVSVRPGRLGENEAGREWRGQIMIDVELLDRRGSGELGVTTVTMHELGHAIGIRAHTSEGLMQSDVSLAHPCIDAYTLELVCNWMACGPEAAPTCP
ncbi:MAG TPA: hypothetical protein VFQ61_24065 [Polyangiaceae bacterium]|nr:hypothetical protein [Polyangiaceae bacterium]